MFKRQPNEAFKRVFKHSGTIPRNEETDMKAEDIAKKAIKVASEICVFTNNNITMEKL